MQPAQLPREKRDLQLLILCTSNRSSEGAQALSRIRSLFGDPWGVPASSASPSAEDAPARSPEAEQHGVKGLLVSPGRMQELLEQMRSVTCDLRFNNSIIER